MIQLMQGDCLDLLGKVDDGSIDLICTDLPYATTNNAWDSLIDLKVLWPEYKRVLVKGGVVVLTAAQPFTSTLVISNLSGFKYQWVWQKSKVTGVLNAKHQPLRQHEDILVFYDSKPVYNPQGTVPCSKRTGTGKRKDGASSQNYGTITQTEDGYYEQTVTGYPRSVLQIASESKTVHPTQKPVALMEYLIKTYTNEGMTVLDSTMGSGTTGVACVNTNRNFIGIERDDAYFKIAEQRIYDAECRVEADKIESLFSGEVFA